MGAEKPSSTSGPSSGAMGAKERMSKTFTAGFPAQSFKTDGFVPNYDTFGHQHHKNPFRDKTKFEEEKENNYWKTACPWGTNAKHQVNPTRTMLMESRKQQAVPHISYDIDGDGVVGARDYFIGKSFDHDRDDRLNEQERKEAIKALKNGWLDQFSFGHDQAGSKRPYPIVQRRGKIMNIDNGAVMQETYPPHWNADVKPKHRTFTEIQNDRTAELKMAANDAINKWCDDNPRMVHELPVEQEFSVKNPPIQRISDRAEAEHQQARVRAGLQPIPTFINPDREMRTPSLEYNEDPEFKSRKEMLEVRRALKVADLEAQRRHGEENYIPLSVRKSKYEMAATKFRASQKNEKTFSQLKEQRRRERIEYDRRHFGTNDRTEYRYSDQDQYWFDLVQRVTNPAALEKVHGKTKNDFQRARSVPAPCLKITEQIPYERETEIQPQDENIDLPDSIEGSNIQERKSRLKSWNPGGITKYKYTTEVIKSGGLKNAPRLFDTLQPEKLSAVDFIPLETYSSFNVIRHDAMKKHAELKAHTKAHGMKSRLLADNNVAGGTHKNDATAIGRSSAGATVSLSGTQSQNRSEFNPSMVVASDTRVGAPMMDRTTTLWRANTTGHKSVPHFKAEDFGVRTGGFQRLEQVETLKGEPLGITNRDALKTR
ncbi:unnamed protein product [Amoebophrya sp. A120]|nr:unnamed protein product [Amoebophrya sp. A120]|eukprot:GSA120T00006524001.1